MAVFWKNIKGTGNATNNKDGLWSWIEWATPSDLVEADVNDNTRTMEWSPKIKCDFGNQGIPEVDLGHIITSKNLSQEIETPITFNTVYADGKKNGNLIFKGSDDATKHHGYLKLEPNTQWDENVKSGYSLTTTHEGKLVNKGQFKNEGPFTNEGPMSNRGSFCNVGQIEVRSDPTNRAGVTIAGKCEAQYFNATSDKRAKENIYPLMASALDIINAVQVYTFNYKNSDHTTIGLIAQEMLPYNLGGATFVSNPDATGEDDDYMSITESKLIYLLLKGIQEQQEQINQLKQRIMDLEGK